MTSTVIADRFELSRLLGRGGMADVYLATDRRLGRQVAVKMLHHNLVSDEDLLERFRREAQSAAKLNHPSIVAVYDTGEHEVAGPTGSVRVPYIVMEHIQGRTLRELLNESAQTGQPGLPPGYRVDPRATQVDTSATRVDTSSVGRGNQPEDPDATQRLGAGAGNSTGRALPLATAQAVELTAGVLAALVYSHRHGVIHRDIKPGNVMLTDGGDVKVMDFGIARATTEATAAMTRTNTVVGTAQYLSPEQARGDVVDARSDLYSTGCLVYELLTGRPPFLADSAVALAYKHVSEIPDPPSAHNPALSASMDAVVMKALAKNADDRYRNAEQFRTDLLAAAAGHSVSAPAAGTAAAAAAAAAALDQPTRVFSRQPPASPPFEPTAAGASAQAGYDASQTVVPEKPRRRAGTYVLLLLGVIAVFGLASWAFLLFNNRSASPAQVAVPEVVGLPFKEASQTLTDKGLEVSRADDKPSDQYDKGVVMEQDPATNTQLNEGDSVKVTVSSGAQDIELPNLRDKTQDEARKILQGLDLSVGRVTVRDDYKIAKDAVIETKPSAGSTVAPGANVELVVSSGNVAVESFVGKDYLAAKSWIESHNLVAEIKFEEVDETPNSVTEQEPASGTLPQGGTVTLWVASESSGSPAPTEDSTTPAVEPAPTDNGGGQ